jgi:hypothetical protein
MTRACCGTALWAAWSAGPGAVHAEVVPALVTWGSVRQLDAVARQLLVRLASAAPLLTAYLRFPVEHQHRIRHSNVIERTFGETRRRVKVIGRLPGEISCLTLVWAVLDRGLPRLARFHHDLRRPTAAPGPAPLAARATPPAAAAHHQPGPGRRAARNRRYRRLT